MKNRVLIPIVGVLIMIEIISIFLMRETLLRKDLITKDEEAVDLKEIKFAIMIEQNEGKEDFVRYNNSEWPKEENGYVFDSDNSYCYDKNKEPIYDILTFKNNKAYVNTSKTSFCNLYFKKSAFATAKAQLNFTNGNGTTVSNKSQGITLSWTVGDATHYCIQTSSSSDSCEWKEIKDKSSKSVTETVTLSSEGKNTYYGFVRDKYYVEKDATANIYLETISYLVVGTAKQYYKSDAYHTKIKNVYIVDYIKDNVKTSSVAYWDLSNKKDESIMGWLDNNGDTKTPYDLYIGSNSEKIKSKDLSSMFYGLSNLEKINGLDKLDTSGVKNMEFMFYGCERLTTLNLSNFDTSNVTNMHDMFRECKNLTSLNLTGWNTSKVKSMEFMFLRCERLTTLNLSSFDTSNVIDMAYMFYGCNSLTSLNLSNFDTSNVTDMAYMFYGCNSLTNLNLSNFNTSNVTTMLIMFGDCRNLTSLNLNGWNTSKVKNMSGMFTGCNSLTSLNLSSFDTSNVTDMAGMVAGCSSLTILDMRNADFSKVKVSDCVFFSNLGKNNTTPTTIYVKDETSKSWIQSRLNKEGITANVQITS